MTPDIREYQQDGAHFLFNQRRAILGDSMGIGKTVQAIQAMRELVLKQELSSVLIVCPGAGLYVWQVELEKWWPEFAGKFTTIRGTQAQRDRFWDDPKTLARQNFGICTYDVLKQDYKRSKALVYWHLIIYDEAHKFKNRRTQIFRTVKKMNSVYCFLLSGTPAASGPQDVWTLLNVIQPRSYTSYWKFIDNYCITSQNLWGGKEIIGTKNMDELQSRMKPYFLRRTKAEVLPELPPKTRSMLQVDMSSDQRKLYTTLRDEMVVDLNESLNDDKYGDPIIASDVLAKITRLRQLLCCPKLLDIGLDIGGGMEAIAEMIEDSDDKHCVIFTQFPSAFAHMLGYLNYLGYTAVSMLRGGMSPKEMAINIDIFKLHRGIMLASIEHAQGYSLETASIAFILGYSWRPDSNYQAEDRLHRLTSQSAVNIYYIQHRGTVDDRVLEILNQKQRNVDALLIGARFNELLDIFKYEG